MRLALLISLVVLLGIMFGAVLAHFDQEKCAEAGAAMRKPHEYTLITGCLIEWRPDEWVPLTAIRAMDEQK